MIRKHRSASPCSEMRLNCWAGLSCATCKSTPVGCLPTPPPFAIAFAAFGSCLGCVTAAAGRAGLIIASSDTSRPTDTVAVRFDAQVTRFYDLAAERRPRRATGDAAPIPLVGPAGLGYHRRAQLPWNFPGEHPEEPAMCRTLMRKAFGFSVVLVALVCLLSGAASAADEQACQAYAVGATAPAVQEAMDVCGYSGDMWSTDFLGHLNWCLRSSPQAVREESERRYELVRKCSRCQNYAKAALSAQEFNDPEGRIRGAADGYDIPPMPCGFSGEAWSSDFKAHARWCASVSDEEARRETEKREALFNICRTCREYAHKAVVAYHNVWDKCKGFWSNPQMSGADWSIDHQHHLRWCLGLAAERRAGILDAAGARRGRIVNACLAKAGAPLVIQPAAKAETYKRVGSGQKRAASRPEKTARKPSAGAAAASKKVSGTGSGSSAMDRLGGGSSPSPGSAGVASGAGSPRGGGGAAARSSSSGSGAGGVAPPATGVNRNAIGGGSSEGVR